MSRRPSIWCAAVLACCFALATPALAQRAAVAESTVPAVRLAPPALPPADPVPSLEPEPRPENAERRLAATLSARRESAPPSTSDFAYQVLMTVIGAVVTALVWKAIN